MREKILHTASELFLNLGFKSVTMDDIAEKMAISKKTIYEYYKNKTALVRATTDFVFTQITERIDNICCEECAISPIGTLFRINDFMMKHLKEDNAPTYQLKKYYPQIFEDLTERRFSVITDGITENLKRGIEEGFYRPDIDVPVIARLYYINIMGIKSSDIFMIKTFKISQLVKTHLLYHIRAIATPKGLKELEKILKNEL
jgi:AcrR family transcriptional regulator